jgi:putative ABC transport system permease protein
MNAQAPVVRLRARALVRPYALIRLYRNRLRVHTAQELLAALGVATGVALVFATLVASGSIAGSAAEVVRAVVGPASFQLRSLDPNGFDERLLGHVEHLAHVREAAPLLEQTASVVAPNGRRVAVDIAGTDISLATLNGLAHQLPLSALSPGGIGLSMKTVDALGLDPSHLPRRVFVDLRGRAISLKVSAVLGRESFGALSGAQVAVMPLARLQAEAGLEHRITRVLVEPEPGQRDAVRQELSRMAGPGVSFASAKQDLALLHQALTPSNQASDLFAVISALLGFLFAFNAMLLTVPERRQAIADLLVDGTKRTAIVQMVLFQALCLGVMATGIGLVFGYVLSVGAFHQSPGYLSRAFVLGSKTVIGPAPIVFSVAGGILATCLASAVPLLDLRRDRPLDAVYSEQGLPGNALGKPTQRMLCIAAFGLLLIASAMFALVPTAAIWVCGLLGVATVLAVPLALRGILAAARFISLHSQRLTILPVALKSLRATTLRSLALAATGAVALFGSVALGGSRHDLLHGIEGYTAGYVGNATVWVVNPGDNQAISDFAGDHLAARLAKVQGVREVAVFQGSLLNVGRRRVWMIGWPASRRPGLLDNQLLSGSPRVAAQHLREGGWITVSAQIAAEHHLALGSTFALATPSGAAVFKVAATTTNFGWSPGAIVMSAVDYSRAWKTTAPSALGVELWAGADSGSVSRAIRTTLGPASGLEVVTAHAREDEINTSAREGLSQLGAISTLLVVAAILALVAALVSTLWQQRGSLAALRIEGTSPARLRRLLLLEAVLMLTAGCLTGALAGIYGQAVIDSYLKHVTGFPVGTMGVGGLPLETFAIVLVAVSVLAAIPGWVTSRVPPTLALEE